MMYTVIFFVCALFTFCRIDAATVDILTHFKVFDQWLEKIKDAGYEVKSFDVMRNPDYEPSPDTKRIILMNRIVHPSALAQWPKEKLVLFVWEAWQIDPSYYELFSKVYTYNDDLVDGEKFFKLYYPDWAPMLSDTVPFEQKKFCTLICMHLSPNRIQILDYFEKHPEVGFDFYGHNISNQYKSYRGPIPGGPYSKDKLDVLKNYRFSICFENTTNVTGYVTEKIFHCLTAGCIPVYFGAPNVDKFIPKDCYIDYRNFANNDDLLKFLQNMPKAVYDRYIERIKAFLNTEKAKLFSLAPVNDAFFDAVVEEPQQMCAKPIKNVDAIYLINLDQRPERLEKCKAQLKPYGIIPERFPAVFGWGLTGEEINRHGVKFEKGMPANYWIARYQDIDQICPMELDFLKEESPKGTVFFLGLTPGAIGCALSHLSILQDAYDKGYETIWVMEDDILVEKNPKQLGDLIDKLDRLVGKEGWDILYTDSDRMNADLYNEVNDFESDLKGDLSVFWRPDLDLSNKKFLRKREILSEDFISIGSRMRTHSMMIRRSGMKKILDFEREHHLFLPWDHEIATVPNIKLMNLRYNLVTASPASSDIRVGNFVQSNTFEEEKRKILNDLPQIKGWRNPEKVTGIMDFIRETKPMNCVEIGSFGGVITYPISKALSCIKQGVVYAIDAWDSSACVEGLEPGQTSAWWRGIDMAAIYATFQELITSKKLDNCRPICKRSKDAVSMFEDGSIDFLYIDGNASKSGSYEDVRLYFPKVKERGYICLNDAYAFNKNLACAFLMENCDWIKDKSIGADGIMFQKKAITEKAIPFIEAQLRGQLAPNMFIVAAASALAWDQGAEACFPELKLRPQNHLEHIFSRCNSSAPLKSAKCIWNEPTFAYHQISSHADMKLYGYFQSEKYFAHHRDKIFALFAPLPQDRDYLHSNYQWILDHSNSVAVHVRDYFDGDVQVQYGMDYLEKAMSLFPKDALFVVFSNNMDFAKRNIPEDKAAQVVFIENEPDYIDLFLMSLCKHNIIANSAFSWWGAWLNQNPNRKVVAPAVWLHPNSGIETQDIMPANWIKVDAHWEPAARFMFMQ